MLKYAYTATFDDDSQFEQPWDDCSQFEPGKSSKVDYKRHALSRRLKALDLMGFDGSNIAWLDVKRGEFVVAGEIRKPGDPLPEGFEWVQGDAAQEPYFRICRVPFGHDMKPSGAPYVHAYVIGVGAAPGVLNFLAVS